VVRTLASMYGRWRRGLLAAPRPRASHPAPRLRSRTPTRSTQPADGVRAPRTGASPPEITPSSTRRPHWRGLTGEADVLLAPIRPAARPHDRCFGASDHLIRLFSLPVFRVVTVGSACEFSFARCPRRRLEARPAADVELAGHGVAAGPPGRAGASRDARPRSRRPTHRRPGPSSRPTSGTGSSPGTAGTQPWLGPSGRGPARWYRPGRTTPDPPCGTPL
jgi:hypothetical protein